MGTAASKLTRTRREGHRVRDSIMREDGATPFYVNLNADSTHPRPWRPPTDWDVMKRAYDPYQIYTRDQQQYFEKKRNWLQEDPALTNMYYAARKGLGFGLLFAALDHVSFSRQQGWKSQAMRAAYITVPIQSMFVSYVALRELSANVMQSYGKNRNSNWTYVAAGMGPGTILMYWHRRPGGAGALLGVMTAMGGILQKEYSDMGRGWLFGYTGEEEEADRKKWFLGGPLDYRSFWRFSEYTKRDPGPTFEKFEDK